MKTSMGKVIVSSILLSVTSTSFAGSFIAEFNKKVSKKEIELSEKLVRGDASRFLYTQSDYFNRVLKLETKMSKQEVVKLLSGISGFVKVEETINIESSSIIPASRSSVLATDPLVNYQWGLDFQGQTVINEYNDLENYEIKGTDKSDIELTSIDNMNKSMSRDVVVAVIDTGIDFNHPDLKSNLFRNIVECDKNGEIPFKPDHNNDGNAFVGDCTGWNFTGKEEGGSNWPEDFVGHGTHVAGVIAAVRNNGIGISGVSNRIKILPIKALSNQSEQSQAIGTSERLAEAILYATLMKADVINLSLGWPISFDKDHLRNAVNEAISKGIIVVAASGNNDHAEPIFPCAYKGVVCVGSVDPNNKISDFSNFGGHVDVLAPGNNILSTIPSAITSALFDIKGYDLKSGTSQSAPYVAALAAVLKGTFPDLTAKQVIARIYNSGGGAFNKGHKYSNGGKINFDKALAEEVKALVIPDFKSLSRIKLDLKTSTFSFDLTLSNLAKDISNVKVNLKNTKDINFNKNNILVKNIAGGKDTVITVSGRLSSINAHVSQKLEVKLSYAGKSQTHTNQIRFYVDFADNDKVLKRAIKGAIPKEILSLNTINYNHGDFDSVAYYSTNTMKDRGIVFTAYEMNDSEIAMVGRTVLDKSVTILSVHRLDMNFDGDVDYMIRSVRELKEEGEEDSTQVVRYTFLNSKLKPLFGKKSYLSTWDLKLEDVIVKEIDNFALVPYTSKELGKILIPVFMDYADQPDADANPNPFARLRRRVFSSKIFYFEPKVEEDKVSFITRTFNNYKFLDAFKERIGHKPFEQVYLLRLFKQSFSDIKDGKIRILLTLDSRSRAASNHVFTITDLVKGEWDLAPITGDNNVNLANFALDRAINLDRKRQVDHDFNLDIVANERLNSLMWEQVIVGHNSTKAEFETVIQKNKLDPIQIALKTYLKGNQVYRFYQTPSRIYMQLNDGGAISNTTLPVHVSTFLPGILFEEQHFPIIFEGSEGAEKYPAFYVDSTQISSQNVYTIVAKENEMIAPISLNVNIPDKCIAKNPLTINGVYHYAILCLKEGGKGEMVYYPVKEM